mmetsp:Transcript_30616/g.39479  ORF Transcript_30616/g.39479 Transcript_30616/m.39479 type:complete len:139 (-) Transcript_30616:592-1008(-)
MQDDWMFEPFGCSSPPIPSPIKKKPLTPSYTEPIILNDHIELDDEHSSQSNQSHRSESHISCSSDSKSQVESIQKLNPELANWRFLFDMLLMESEMYNDKVKKKLNKDESNSDIDEDEEEEEEEEGGGGGGGGGRRWL